jgi:hypothetical protein
MPSLPLVSTKSQHRVFAAVFHKHIRARFAYAAGAAENNACTGFEANGISSESGLNLLNQGRVLNHSRKTPACEYIINIAYVADGKFAAFGFKLFRRAGHNRNNNQIFTLIPKIPGSILFASEPNICCGDLHEDKFGKSSGLVLFSELYPCRAAGSKLRKFFARLFSFRNSVASSMTVKSPRRKYHILYESHRTNAATICPIEIVPDRG